MATDVKNGVSTRRNGKKSGLLERGKSLVGKTKDRMFVYALGEALGILGHSSEENYTRIAQLFRAQADSPNKKVVADWVEHYFSPEGQGRQYVKRVLTQIHPNVRRNYLARFINTLVFHDMSVPHYASNGREVTSPACVVLSPTMRCNLRCHGCYAGSYTKEDDLPQDVLERVIGEARDLGVHFYIVSGGEPLVYEPLFDVFKKFNDCAFQFYTSGQLINEQKAKKIVELGNVVPAISLEGFKEQTELRRGPHAFERAMRAMDILREARALFAFSVTVTRLNFDEVTSDAFMDMLIEKGAGYGWYFTYVPIGRNPDISLMPTPEQRNKLRIFINHIRQTRPMLIGDFWNDGALSEGCLSGGRRYLHINNKGDVEPCVFIHFAVDNVKEKPLVDCLASDWMTAIRKAAPFGTNLLRPCPIIDHPHVLRGLVKKFNPRPTHEGAESVVSELAEALDEYGAGVKAVYDPVWVDEYQWAAVLHDKPQYRRPS